MGYQAQGLLDYRANGLTDNENVLSRSGTIGLTNYRTMTIGYQARYLSG